MGREFLGKKASSQTAEQQKRKGRGGGYLRKKRVGKNIAVHG